jgi:aconitate hydratase 2 / 2-methylisocitrate dehydratase
VLDDYRNHRTDRALAGVPPRPLTAARVEDLTLELRAEGDPGRAAELVDVLAHGVAPGVDDAARCKATFLASVARGQEVCLAISSRDAVTLLGTMVGGYNVAPLVELLNHEDLGAVAAEQLSATLLVFDAFHDVAELARGGNRNAAAVMKSWAAAAWFTRRPPLPDVLNLTVVKVGGEINTDDMSPAPHAWSRADIPLHAQSFLEHRRDVVDVPALMGQLRFEGRPVAFVGEVIGTGSSRKSAVNSLLWHIGEDIPFVPGKRRGGVVVANRIAPIFFNTLLDAGAFPIECEVERLATGDHIVLRPRQGRIERPDGQLLASFELRPAQLLDYVRGGGRLQLIIGRNLTDKARSAIGLEPSLAFRRPAATKRPKGFTLAQKIMGRACGVDGVAPGTYCEPTISTVGSQDTTGPMNRQELEDLACLGFSADLVLQTFCHTAAYPKPVDIQTQRTLPQFISNRGGVVMRPGDGIIHSWLNRMLLPDQVGTGSDSHTRFPLGISFPAGSGLVAFAAALGVMPIDMPESVLVRFRGTRQPGITLRDLVNAIPYEARRNSPAPSGSGGHPNPFSGRIIEIEGLDHLSVEEAFELTDSTAERSAAGCTINLSVESVASAVRANVALLRSLIDSGYQDARTLERRARAMERWLAQPTLLRADDGARYAAVIDIDVSAISEPLLACPNDPDDVRPLSDVAGRPVDEVFIGSCMTNVAHFRAAGELLAAGGGPAPTRLWMAPPTRLAETELREEGYYSTFGSVGARTEIPGCSLCMGNQARVREGATVVSTSTRNFPNRMGRDAKVFLASAQVAAIAAMKGALPTVAEYMEQVGRVESPPPGAFIRDP